MTDYAVGDLQGCFDPLLKLLDKINFSWSKDRLWVCGDVVNRGPQSLNTLRYLYEHRDSVRLVLGNHDLHMLAVANGATRLKSKDTFHSIVENQENRDLIDWLYQQPLAYYESKINVCMVHAGIPMFWTLADTLKYAEEISSLLRDSKSRQTFFKSMYGDQPALWKANLSDIDRHRYITNALTRMRFCALDGSLELKTKLPPGQQPKALIPWYRLPLKIDKNVRVVFGHWASLEGRLATNRFQALDTGCVWGGKLTALNLNTWQRTSV